MSLTETNNSQWLLNKVQFSQLITEVSINLQVNWPGNPTTDRANHTISVSEVMNNYNS